MSFDEDFVGDDSSVFNDDEDVFVGDEDGAENVFVGDDSLVSDDNETKKETKVKGKPGRPRIYGDELRRYLSVLISENGLLGTKKIVSADSSNPNEKELAETRDQSLIPADKPINPSIPTLRNIANEFEIEVKRGRRASTSEEAA